MPASHPFDSRSRRVKCLVGTVALWQYFPSTASTIPPTLHIHIHLRVAPSRRTNSLSLGTVQKAASFPKSGGGWHWIEMYCHVVYKGLKRAVCVRVCVCVCVGLVHVPCSGSLKCQYKCRHWPATTTDILTLPIHTQSKQTPIHSKANAQTVTQFANTSGLY